jgi:hypothetical protein
MSMSTASEPTPAGGLDVTGRRLYTQARAAVRGVADSGGVRILWSGSRVWSEHRELLERVALPVVYGALEAVPDPNRVGFMHGAARGLDQFIHALSRRPLQFPARWAEEVYPIMSEEREVYGVKAGIARDRRMIENAPTMVIGLPHPASKTGGTWACLRLAYSAGIPAFAVREITGFGWRVEQYRPHGHRQFEVLF